MDRDFPGIWRKNTFQVERPGANIYETRGFNRVVGSSPPFLGSWVLREMHPICFIDYVHLSFAHSLRILHILLHLSAVPVFVLLKCPLVDLFDLFVDWTGSCSVLCLPPSLESLPASSRTGTFFCLWITGWKSNSWYSPFWPLGEITFYLNVNGMELHHWRAWFKMQLSDTASRMVMWITMRTIDYTFYGCRPSNRRRPLHYIIVRRFLVWSGKWSSSDYPE